MSTRKLLLALPLMMSFGAGTAFAESPGLGKPITEADIKALYGDVSSCGITSLFP